MPSSHARAQAVATGNDRSSSVTRVTTTRAILDEYGATSTDTDFVVTRVAVAGASRREIDHAVPRRDRRPSGLTQR